MKIFLFILCMFIFAACGRGGDENDAETGDIGSEIDNRWVDIAPIPVVFVQGGDVFSEGMGNLYSTPIVVQDFYIGRFEVTQRQWIEVMGENPSLFDGEERLDFPVERVSWYDAILFLNRRSEMAGLQPFYNIDKDTPDEALLYNEWDEYVDELRWTVTINPDANGYRLPTNIEWEFAAGGGLFSHGYAFSGSDDPFEVGFTFRNSGDEFLDEMWHWPTLEANNGRTHRTGSLRANELGIFDMTGNVREWIFNWHQFDALTPASGYGRTVRGGSWVSGEDAGRIYFRDSLPPHFAFEDLGLRVARNAG